MMSLRVGRYGLLLAFLCTMASVSAADTKPGNASLEAMGLGGLQIMSDDEAMTVRGFGYGSQASAWGQSWASVGRAGSTNGYNASGPHYASGENYSEAGIQITTSGGGGGHPNDDHHGGKKDGGWGGDPPRGDRGGRDWKDPRPNGGDSNHHPKNGDMHDKPRGDNGNMGGGHGKPNGDHGKPGGKPGHGKPNGDNGNMGGGKPGHGKPGGDMHGGGKPNGGKPGHGKPGGDMHSGGKPGHGKPGGGMHGGGKPTTKSIRVYAGGYSKARAG